MIASEGTHQALQFLTVALAILLAFLVFWFPALKAYGDLQKRLGVEAAHASRWRAWLIGPPIPLGTIVSIPVRPFAAITYWILRDKASESSEREN